MKTFISPSQLPAGQLPLFLVCLSWPKQRGQPDSGLFQKQDYVLFQEVKSLNSTQLGLNSYSEKSLVIPQIFPEL